MSAHRDQSMASHSKTGDESQCHSRKSFDSCQTASKPHSEKSLTPRESLSVKISPPALKRHRIISDIFNDGWERSSSSPLPTGPETDPDRTQLRIFGSHVKPIVDKVEHKRSFDSLRLSSSLLATSVHREFARRDSSTSARETDGTYSSSSSRRSSISKRTCRVCEKRSATNYNPIIICLGCKRAYHDSCRKPPLIDGTDPQLWRCSKCLGGPRKRKRSTIDASQPSKAVLNSLSTHDSTLKAIVPSTPRTIGEGFSRVAPYSGLSDDSFQVVTSKSLDCNSPNITLGITPSVPEPQLASLEHDASVKTTIRQSQERAYLMIFCADCRQRYNITESSINNVKCSSCQDRMVYIETYEPVVPETPDACRVQTPDSLQNTNIVPKPLPPLPPQKAQSLRAIKSISKTKTLRRSTSGPGSGGIDVVSTCPNSARKHVDANFMPFERAIPRQPRTWARFDTIDKAGKYYEVMSRDHQSLVETMTQSEKARKIAEIKGRCSRKTLFERDHKLGHVRRYQRQDIHDERDGMWKPACRTVGGGSLNGEMKDREGVETLQEAFGLPENVVPVNDGQTELAFRDAAMTNGRLPRSRLMYKVGKLFGGELTVRTS